MMMLCYDKLIFLLNHTICFSSCLSGIDIRASFSMVICTTDSNHLILLFHFQFHPFKTSYSNARPGTIIMTTVCVMTTSLISEQVKARETF